jgi:DNA-binding NtrC family response regulator
MTDLLINAFLEGKATLSDLGRKPRTLAEIEKDAIDLAIIRNGGNKSAAAEELGISLKTIYNKLQLWREGDESGRSKQINGNVG